MLVPSREPVMIVTKARFDSVQDDIARQLANISSYNERHLQAVTRLEEKDPEIPEDSDSEVTRRPQTSADFSLAHLNSPFANVGCLDQFFFINCSKLCS